MAFSDPDKLPKDQKGSKSVNKLSLSLYLYASCRQEIFQM